MASGTEASLGLSVPVSEVLDPALWLRRYAWPAVDSLRFARLRDTAGKIITTIPADVIVWHLKTALSEAQLKIGVPMGIRVVKGSPVDDGLVLGRDYDVEEPRRSFYNSEAKAAWNKIDLPAGVISVQRVRAFYFGTLIWTLDPTVATETDAIHLQWPEAGTLRLMPTTTVGLVLNADLILGLYQTLGGYGRITPNVWSVDYTMGPTDELGRPGMIDAVLAHWVGCKAGITLINQVGLAQSKGLSSTSISMDGLSRSVSLQASAMYGINSCLERVYDEACKSIDWKALRLRKRGIQVRSYGA